MADIKEAAPPPVLEVRALGELLAGQLGDGEQVEEYSAVPATALGDNYGSTMLALDVVIRAKDADGGDAEAEASRRHLRAFCKMLPDDPERRVVFCVDVTFVKEMQMYTLVLPALLKLQLDCGVADEDLVSHLLPACYGGRVSMSGDDVDDDAALLLEDLRVRGFVTGDRIAGLDLEHAKLILEKLAVLHALPIALRRKQPEAYESSVLQACRDFQMGHSEKDAPKFAQCILHNVDKAPGARRHREAVARLCDAATAAGDVGREAQMPPPREPFATILHNDLWTNNVLVRRDVDGAPVEVAIIDFQVSRINSPFKDLLFFLFTSVALDVCAEHLDALVEAYHASLCRCLESCGVAADDFPLEAAWAEIRELAHTELFHILFMQRIITADPQDIRDNPETFAFMLDLGRELYTARVEQTVCTFADRGWLPE